MRGTSIPWPIVVGVALLVVLAFVAIALSNSTTTSVASGSSDTVAEAVYREDTPPFDPQPRITNPNIEHSEARERLPPVATRAFLGIVQDVKGQPLSGVQVHARGGDLMLMTTDERGEFSFTPETGSSSLLFLSKSGYRPETVHLSAPPAAEEHERWSRVITMTAIGPTYPVDGHVVADRGHVPYATMAHLSSRSNRARYSAVVDDKGYYRFPAVEAGGDYQLRVGATRYIKNVERGPLEILGPTTMQEVRLRGLRRAGLSVQLLGSDGYPVARRDVIVDIESDRSLTKRATTDYAGMFTLKDVPEGRLTIATAGFPKLEVSDIEFEAWQDTTLVLTLDVGDLSLRGKVVDESGRPVPGAIVEVSGTGSTGETTSRFTFRAHSNRIGDFELSQLAPGTHQLSVRSPRFETLEVEVIPGDGPVTLVLHES